MQRLGSQQPLDPAPLLKRAQTTAPVGSACACFASLPLETYGHRCGPLASPPMQAMTATRPRRRGTSPGEPTISARHGAPPPVPIPAPRASSAARPTRQIRAPLCGVAANSRAYAPRALRRPRSVGELLRAPHRRVDTDRGSQSASSGRGGRSCRGRSDPLPAPRRGGASP